MAVHFVLKRFLPEFGEGKTDLYEAIKTGMKTVEYRDATPYWAKRLLNNHALKQYHTILQDNKDKTKPHCVRYKFGNTELKHTEATFRVGYTRGPTLHAAIHDIIWKVTENQFVVRIYNVRETP